MPHEDTLPSLLDEDEDQSKTKYRAGDMAYDAFGDPLIDENTTITGDLRPDDIPQTPVSETPQPGPSYKQRMLGYLSLQGLRKSIKSESTPKPTEDELLNGIDYKLLFLLGKPQQLPDGTYLKFRASGLRAELFDTIPLSNKRLDHAQSLYAELRDVYGVQMPNVTYKLGSDTNGNQGYFRRSEPVHGKNLAQVLAHVPSDQLEAHYVSLAHYYGDKAKSDGDYPLDIANDQFMYGRREGDTVDKIYLVDQEPLYSNRSAVERYAGTSLKHTAHLLAKDVLQAQAAGKDLPESKQAVLALLALLPEGPQYPLYDDLANKLKAQ